MGKKICFVSSSGGHWEELMCLYPIAKEHDSFFVTEEGGQVSDRNLNQIYTFRQINRKEKTFLFHFVRLFAFACKIISKERPDVVITTGALVAYPFCLIAKLCGKKVVYVESFARVNNRSLTGRLVYPFADLFLVQWESMLDCYPNAKYVGGIF
ncbi:MAG: polysaccharide biosynthesis protein [Oscillospiraceae bacterium]|nr:polysaccharide biosynthesis protein [Oscillospiraceae bacterium]